MAFKSLLVMRWCLCLLALFICPQLTSSSPSSSKCSSVPDSSAAVLCCSVLSYGAKGDGTHDDSEAVQAAVNDCLEAGLSTNTNDTAAIVYFPPEHTYVTGLLSLGLNPRNIRIHIPRGSTLLRGGSTDTWPTGSPVYDNERKRSLDGQMVTRSSQVARDLEETESVQSDLPGMHTPWISWMGGENVTWSGAGLIDGQGKEWWDLEANRVLCQKRPHMFYFIDTRHLTMVSLHLLNAPHIHIKFVNVSLSVFDALDIFATHPSNNTAAIAATACHDIVIQNCNISVDDDIIVLRPLKAPAYYLPNETLSVERGGPWTNDPFTQCARDILVQNCHFGTGHGVSIGIGSGSGCTKNITIRDITMDGSTIAARLKTTWGGITSAKYLDHYWTTDGTEVEMKKGYLPNEVPKGAIKLDAVTEFRDMTFENFRLNDVKRAIVLNQEYHLKQVSQGTKVVVPNHCLPTPTPTKTPSPYAGTPTPPSPSLPLSPSSGWESDSQTRSGSSSSASELESNWDSGSQSGHTRRGGSNSDSESGSASESRSEGQSEISSPSTSSTPELGYLDFVLIRDVTFRNFYGSGGSEPPSFICNNLPGLPCSVELDRIDVKWRKHKKPECEQVDGPGVKEFCEQSRHLVVKIVAIASCGFLLLLFIAAMATIIYRRRRNRDGMIVGANEIEEGGVGSSDEGNDGGEEGAIDLGDGAVSGWSLFETVKRMIGQGSDDGARWIELDSVDEADDLAGE